MLRSNNRRGDRLAGAAVANMVILSVAIAGCSQSANNLVRRFADPDARPERFLVCHGYGCRTNTEVRLSSEQWRHVTLPFAKPAENAYAEREQIAMAIMRMEVSVGELAQTAGDLPKSPNFISTRGQMDCIDETVNTYTYLAMLQQHRLLRWHRVATPAHRGFIFDGHWPHNTATVEELATGQVYTIDSWPEQNGGRPEMIKLEEWLAYPDRE